MSHYLYKHYDQKDKLLYVGISHKYHARLDAHEKNAKWFKEIHRIEVSIYKDKKSAADAEKLLIKKERPPYNIKSNPDNELPGVKRGRGERFFFTADTEMGEWILENSDRLGLYPYEFIRAKLTQSMKG